MHSFTNRLTQRRIYDWPGDVDDALTRAGCVAMTYVPETAFIAANLTGGKDDPLGYSHFVVERRWNGFVAKVRFKVARPAGSPFQRVLMPPPPEAYPKYQQEVRDGVFRAIGVLCSKEMVRA